MVHNGRHYAISDANSDHFWGLASWNCLRLTSRAMLDNVSILILTQIRTKSDRPRVERSEQFGFERQSFKSALMGEETRHIVRAGFVNTTCYIRARYQIDLDGVRGGFELVISHKSCYRYVVELEDASRKPQVEIT